MNRIILNEVKELYEEFPFLPEILRAKNGLPWEPWEIKKVTIKRADENLLYRIPRYYKYSGSCGDECNFFHVHFVLNNNNIIKYAVLPQEVVETEWTPAEETAGQMIWEGLAALPNPDDVQYIVWVEGRYSYIEGQEEPFSVEVKIYKKPKNVEYSALIQKIRKEQK